jgi:hypothetical protein
MRKLVNMVLALAVLAVFLIGCGGAHLCPTCGVDNPLTEEMIRFNKKAGASGGGGEGGEGDRARKALGQ